MEQPSQISDNKNLTALESQIRECYGRVVYSHKTHEKCADIYFVRTNRFKNAQIILLAITTTSLTASIIGRNAIGLNISAFLSALSFYLSVYLKDYNPGSLADAHKDTASKLWEVREKYLSLLTDIRCNLLPIDSIIARRDELQDLLSSIYTVSPRTLPKAYSKASKGLKEMEELTFSDDEIDKFLPTPLRKGQINTNTNK